MKIVFVMIFVLVFLISFCGCDDGNPSSQNSSGHPYISFEHIPCKTEGLFKESFNEIPSIDWSIDKNILNLKFNFTANCAAEFIDSSTFNVNELSVNLTNISLASALCVCDHEAKVSLYVGMTSEVRILLSTKSSLNNEYHLLLDTLLSIR